MGLLYKIHPLRGVGFIIKRECCRRSPPEAHCLLVGFVVLVTAAVVAVVGLIAGVGDADGNVTTPSQSQTNLVLSGCYRLVDTTE